MTTTATLPDLLDSVVIGGGAAGLAGAITLARSRRSVLVVDSGAPRNAPADGVHALLGHEGIAPAELLARGRAELAGYGGRLLEAQVSAVSGSEGDFTVALADGRSVRARRVLVTTGLLDELPDVPGVAEQWGHGVVHCPYCHGWEVRDRTIAVLGTSPNSVHQALLFSHLSDQVTLVVHVADVVNDEQRAQLAASGVEVLDARVAALESADGEITGLRLADGALRPCEVVVVATRMVARTGFLAPLGLLPVAHPSGMGEHLQVDPAGRTSVPGVWAAGNVADLSAQVGAAAAAGTMAGAQINADLVMERARTALA